MKEEFLNQYLRRIGFQGEPKDDLQTLAQITQRHTATIPFECLNPLLHIPVTLDIDSLYRKMVIDHRGGYCFEQNGLLLDVLTTIGFNAKGLLGKVFHKDQRPEDMIRTHMIIFITINNTAYIADVGFGGLDPTIPIRFETNIIQKTPREDYRIIGERNHFILQIFSRQKWISLYLFDLQEQYPVDFEVANWYTSTSPAASFTNHLMASIAGDDCRYTLRDNELTKHFLDKESERTRLTAPEVMRSVLQDIFRLRLHNMPGLDKKLTAFTKG